MRGRERRGRADVRCGSRQERLNAIAVAGGFGRANRPQEAGHRRPCHAASISFRAAARAASVAAAACPRPPRPPPPRPPPSHPPERDWFGRELHQHGVAEDLLRRVRTTRQIAKGRDVLRVGTRADKLTPGAVEWARPARGRDIEAGETVDRPLERAGSGGRRQPAERGRARLGVGVPNRLLPAAGYRRRAA